jgi:hypothetical protein
MNKNNISYKILKQVFDIAIAYIFSIIITYFFAGNKLFSSTGVFFQNTLYGFCLSITLWKGSALLGRYIGKKFPWSVKPLKTLVLNSSFTIAFAIADIFLINLIFSGSVFKVGFFEEINHFMPIMLVELVISVVITLTFYLVYFYKWWRIADLNQVKLEREAIQLRYDVLKSQVNPHFLFNSLSVLSSLVDTDAAKAKQFIQQFSDIYRYVLDQNDKELVPLEDEVNFARAFIHLNQIRYDSSLQVSVNITDVSGFIIPLSLQTLLENCFKHNVISSENPLTIKLWREGSYLYIWNNIQKRKIVEKTSGIGIEIISKRYEYLTQQPLLVEQNESNFTVRIPIVKSVS